MGTPWSSKTYRENTTTRKRPTGRAHWVKIRHEYVPRFLGNSFTPLTFPYPAKQQARFYFRSTSLNLQSSVCCPLSSRSGADKITGMCVRACVTHRDNMGPSAVSTQWLIAHKYTHLCTQRKIQTRSVLYLGTNSLTSHPPPSLYVQLSETFIKTEALLWPNVLLISWYTACIFISNEFSV